MNVDLLERFACSKTGDPDGGEDGILEGDGFFGIVDGETSKSGTEHGGRTPGRIARDLLIEAVAQLDPADDARSSIRFLSDHLAAGIQAIQDHSSDPPAAVLAIYSVRRREVWRVGDIGVSVDGAVLLGRKAIDDVTANARVALLHALIQQGKSVEELRETDPGREMILPLLREQAAFRNLDSDSPFAFGALDGSFVPDRFIETWPVPDGVSVVLASDGYPVVAPDLAQAEELLRRDLDRDPLRILDHRGTKAVPKSQVSYDDRAYLRLTT